MKKLVLVLLAVIIFAGCTGKDGPVGPAGPQGPGQINTYNYTVPQGNWTKLSDGSYSINLLMPSNETINLDNQSIVIYTTWDYWSNIYVEIPATWYNTNWISYTVNFIDTKNIQIVENGMTPYQNCYFKVVITEK